MNPFQILSLALGSIMLLVGLWGLAKPEALQSITAKIPRNVWLGRFLFLFDLVWSLFLLKEMTLGDFETLRFVFGPIDVPIPVKSTAYVLSPFIYLFVIILIPEYLGARSVGLFMILLAKPVLWISYNSDSPWSVVVSALAYLWIVMGMCIVAVPHWMRDMICFWSGRPARWKFATGVRVVLGAFLIVIGFLAK